MSGAAVGLAAKDSSYQVSPWGFQRRALRDEDVGIKILYCGMCHSDLHSINGDWGAPNYPLIPGHEIVGQVCSNLPAYVQTTSTLADRDIAVGFDLVLVT